MHMIQHIPAIYLAAGQSRRMGVPKLTLELSSSNTLGSLALRALLASGLQHVYVVVQPTDDLSWLPADLLVLASAPAGPLHIVACDDAAQGMAHSLRAGLAAAVDDSTRAVLIALADQPFVQPRMFKELLAAYKRQPCLDYAASLAAGSSADNAADIDNIGGNSNCSNSPDSSECSDNANNLNSSDHFDGYSPSPPAVLSRSMFPAIMGLSGDTGARKLMQDEQYRGVLTGWYDPLSMMDVDHLTDWQQAVAHYSKLPISNN